MTRAQPLTAFASSRNLKRRRVASSAEDSSKASEMIHGRRPKRVQKKGLFFLFEETVLIPNDFHQPRKRCSTDDSTTIWLLTRLFFVSLSPEEQLATCSTPDKALPYLLKYDLYHVYIDSSLYPEIMRCNVCFGTEHFAFSEYCFVVLPKLCSNI